jgi:2,4-didehydro-3-deoxy-L-rhamnonate hydrolase
VRLATIAGRATVLTSTSAAQEALGVDVERASEGRFGPDVQPLYARWEEFTGWAANVSGGSPVDLARLGNPVPAPSQVFAIGLNYLDHASEAGLQAERGAIPPTFTKFPSSLAGPCSDVVLPSDKVDWEIELVAVIGRPARSVPVADGWSYVAGLAIGQDYSERAIQMVGPAPQFSLGKSYTGFGPVGPWLSTPEELSNRDDLELICEINGEQVQKGRTSAMVWSIPELVAVLSGICVLNPGDVIFTGTPAGVGMARSPQRYLAPGDLVTSRIEGIGEMQQRCVAGS